MFIWGTLKAYLTFYWGHLRGVQWGNYKHTHCNDESLETINGMSLAIPSYLE